MESNRSIKRKGFTKSKMLKSLYRGGKPHPDPSAKGGPPPLTTAAVIIVKQDQVFPSHQKPKVAFVVPHDRDAEYGKLENFCGGDEAVDAKAARYISGVQERFRLELISSERKNFQDMQQLM